MIERRRRRRVLLFLGIAVVALFILAGGLSDMQLRAGTNLVLERKDTPQPNADREPSGNFTERYPQPEFYDVLSRILFWVLILLTLYAIIFERTGFLKRIMGAMMGLMGILLLAKVLTEMELEELFQPIASIPTDSAVTWVALPVAGEPSTYVIFLMGFIIVLAFFFGVHFTWRQLHTRWTTEERIRLQAREALPSSSP